jgi:hypothetical protein
VTSDAQARAREEDDAAPTAQPSADARPRDETTADPAAVPDATEPTRRRSRRSGRGGHDRDAASRTRIALPVVPVLAVLLVLLLGAGGYLWFTRPGGSSVRTGDYVEALQAARSGVVDLTSFDFMTLDDDIEQVRRVTTGDLTEESVAELDGRRQEITDAQAVVNTEVLGAGVTRADADDATVMLLIQSTQETGASEQAQILRYRIQVELQKVDGRWLLSGISGR